MYCAFIIFSYCPVHGTFDSLLQQLYKCDIIQFYFYVLLYLGFNLNCEQGYLKKL